YLPTNIVQTNLTLIAPRTLELLKRFTHVSFSLDLFGGLRITSSGKDIQSTILKNLSLVVNSGIRCGAIVVLTKYNLPRIDEIFNFFNHARLSFRVLPFYRSANSQQIDEYALAHQEIVSAYSRLIDLWFSKGSGITIKPIDDYIAAVAAKRCLGQNELM